MTATTSSSLSIPDEKQRPISVVATKNNRKTSCTNIGTLRRYMRRLGSDAWIGDESLERDVLSAKAFENGISFYGKRGVYLYIGGEETTEPNEKRGVDVPGKQYACKPAQLPKLLKTLRFNVSADSILKAIRDYDMAVMEGGQPADVSKRYATNTIGKVKRRQDGTYDKSTYSLDSTLLTIRTLAQIGRAHV